MLSAEDIAALKVAVEICNNPELKREILRAPGADKKWHPYDRKDLWYGIMDKKATAVVKILGLPEYLQKKVTGVVLQTGMRMLTWAEYHEGTLGLSREYSSTFLNSSFFTKRGNIDNKKAAGELMSDKTLSIEQKYKLACLYCSTDHITALHKQMTKQDKEKFYHAGALKQPKLVTFWSYYLIGEVDKIRNGKTVDMFRLDAAVMSGCEEAVEYCLDRTNLKRNKDAIVDAAVQAVRSMCNYHRIFQEKACGGRYLPTGDYFMNILCFLLSKMTEDQQINFLKTDIPHDPVETNSYRILVYFLYWPYQEYFMETAKMMWEFLPEKDYFRILIEICDQLELEYEYYGEEKSYDYRGLLKEFWRQSPEHYKRYIFRNQEIAYEYGKVVENDCARLLSRLLTLKNFTPKDRKNIELILASATEKEKENITSSEELENVFCELMQEKWDALDRFAFICDSSKENFKRKFIFTKGARNCCIHYFVEKDRWDAAESLVKWSSLPEAEVDKLKREVIDSEEGKYSCMDLISYERKLETVDKFVAWCFPSEEEAKAFKKRLILSNEIVCYCAALLIRREPNLVNELTSFGFLSEEEIKKLKKNVAYEKGSSICEMLISEYGVNAVYDEKGNKIGRMTEFQGGKWEKVQMFLTWCFTSEEEILDFKKNLIEMGAVYIHYNLISANQWEEAETFFVWLGLSTEELTKLKNDTLYEFGMEEINELLHANNDLKYFDIAYGKWEKIELFLRWCLSDKEAALEFKEIFDEVYGFKSYVNEAEMPENEIIALNEFYSLIEELINNLSWKSEGAEKRPEISVKEFPDKRLLDVKFGN